MGEIKKIRCGKVKGVLFYLRSQRLGSVAAVFSRWRHFFQCGIQQLSIHLLPLCAHGHILKETQTYWSTSQKALKSGLSKITHNVVSVFPGSPSHRVLLAVVLLTVCVSESECVLTTALSLCWHRLDAGLVIWHWAAATHIETNIARPTVQAHTPDTPHTLLISSAVGLEALQTVSVWQKRTDQHRMKDYTIKQHYP